MSKHTAGKWKVVENGGRMVGVMSGRAWVVYKSGNDCMLTEELESNALLIAAAPDLLEALEQTRNELQRLMPMMQADESGLGPDCTSYFQAIFNAGAAIAKATGEA